MTRRGDWAWKKAMKIVRAKTILGENVITDQVNAVAKGLRRERRRAVGVCKKRAKQHAEWMKDPLLSYTVRSCHAASSHACNYCARGIEGGEKDAKIT